MKVIIAGGGIGGPSLAFSLHQIGIESTVFESSPAIEFLGLGINLQANAVRELTELGLRHGLAKEAIPTGELAYYNRHGQLIWSEPRSLAAGFVMLYQILFPLGFTAASLSSVRVIPHLGWRWMFVLGALPAFLQILTQRRVPESPRWLARNGRLEEANTVLTKLEVRIFGDSEPPVLVPAPAGESRASVKFVDLFRGIYRGRTICVWVMWFCASLIGFGSLLWLPSLFHSVYRLSVDQSLQHSVLENITVLFIGVVSAFVIDRVVRKTVFAPNASSNSEARRA